MKVLVSSHFKKKYKKLPKTLKDRAKKQEEVFRENPFDPRLETHKLHGKYKNYHAFSVTSSYRIMFEFLGNDTVAFIDIDDHSLYR